MTGSTTAPKKGRGGGYNTKDNSSFHHFKVCKSCGVEKALAEFYRRSGTTNKRKRASDPTKYETQCKSCRKPVRAPSPEAFADRKPKRKKQTPEERRAHVAAYKARVRAQTRAKLLRYAADRGCETCGERDPRVLEFDHRNREEKHTTIAQLLTNGQSWSSPSLRTELRKCRILCANCHARHTAAQLGYYADPSVRRELADICREYGISGGPRGDTGKNKRPKV